MSVREEQNVIMTLQKKPQAIIYRISTETPLRCLSRRNYQVGGGYTIGVLGGECLTVPSYHYLTGA